MSEVAQAPHSSPDGRIPQLRFPEFDGVWESRLLKDAVKINPRSGELPDEFIYIDLESVKKGYLIKETQINKIGAPSRAQRLLNKNDVIFQTVRPYQKNNYFFNLDGDYVASTGYAQLRVLNSPEFLYQALHTDRFVYDVMARSTGTSYPAINSTDLSKIKLNLPTKPEQQKIAAFLTAVDNKIEQLSTKQVLLGEYKKGLMQQIFSQAIRFKADDGSDFPDWKENKVDEFMEVTRGQVLAVPEMRQVESEIFKYPVYSSQTKNNGLTGYYTDYLFEDCITWTTDGANAGDVNYRAGKFYCTNVCGVLRSKKGYANLCIAQILNSVSRRYVSYVGNPKLMNNVMEKIKISIPSSINEQTKIANFLSSVDSKIEEVGKQLDESKQFKKALLQKMFV